MIVVDSGTPAVRARAILPLANLESLSTAKNGRVELVTRLQSTESLAAHAVSAIQHPPWFVYRVKFAATEERRRLTKSRDHVSSIAQR